MLILNPELIKWARIEPSFYYVHFCWKIWVFDDNGWTHDHAVSVVHIKENRIGKCHIGQFKLSLILDFEIVWRLCYDQISEFNKNWLINNGVCYSNLNIKLVTTALLFVGVAVWPISRLTSSSSLMSSNMIATLPLDNVLWIASTVSEPSDRD